jgi:hypothetical protein
VSAAIEPRLLFYDVDQIAQVGAGSLADNEIQPYTFMSLPEPFALPENPAVYSPYGLMAYDSATQRLYISQRYVGPNAVPAIHVLQLSAPSGGDTLAPAAPSNLRVIHP